MVKNKIKNKKAPRNAPPVEKVNTNKGEECKDRLCPTHGDRKLKTRGRTFEGIVVKKLHSRVTIQFERMLKLPKYERYEKRKTKIHARLPDCINSSIEVGDLIQIAETRPVSKMIHFVVSKLIKTGEKKK